MALLVAAQLTGSGQCASAEQAQEAFASGDASRWDNYSEGPGARVQRQHPDTGLWAQAKFIDNNGTGVAICQYNNHVGVLFTAVIVGAEKVDQVDGAYWRSEWVESYPEQDRPGAEMMGVCMENKGNGAFPSVGCRFSVRP